MKNLFLIFMACIAVIGSVAQDSRRIDSLNKQLTLDKQNREALKIASPSLYDTTAANILFELSRAYWGNDADKATEYANQCLQISGSIPYKKGIGNAYHSLGWISGVKGDYLSALELLGKALKIREEIQDKKGIAATYNNIGLIFMDMGNYSLSLKNYFNALRIQEEIGDSVGIGRSYSNIGSLYVLNNNLPEALKNHLAALKIRELLPDKSSLSSTYNNIGVIYESEGDYDAALKYYSLSLKIQEEFGDKSDVAIEYVNIGGIFEARGDYEEAMKKFQLSLNLFQEIGNKKLIAGSYIKIGALYFKLKKYAEAADYFNKSLALSKEIGSLDDIRLNYKYLSELDSVNGDFKKGWDHLQLYYRFRDSILNNENSRKISQQQMQYDFDKKESLLKVESDKELQKQKLVRNGFVGGTVLFLMLAGAIFIGWRKTRKEKKKSEELLLNILPAEVAEEIKTTGKAKAKPFTMVTVMFTDFKDFTTISERVSAELLVDEIHTCFSAFDRILQKYRIEKIKTIGDAYMCASGLPVSNYTHATDMLKAAFEIMDFIEQRKKEKEERGEIPFELRIGIHTGPVVAGIVGVNKYAYDIWGDTVNLAARMEQNSEPGKINISGSTYELVKDKFTCTYRGKVKAKNKGEVDMYFVDARIEN